MNLYVLRIEKGKIRYLYGPFLNEEDAKKYDGIIIEIPTRRISEATNIIKTAIKIKEKLDGMEVGGV